MLGLIRVNYHCVIKLIRRPRQFPTNVNRERAIVSYKSPLCPCHVDKPSASAFVDNAVASFFKKRPSKVVELVCFLQDRPFEPQM